MKRSLIKVLLSLSLLLFGVSSCIKDDTPTPDKGDAVAARISAGIQTKAHDAIWEDNDEIGLIMVNPLTLSVVEPYRNYGYTTSGDGNFSPLSAEHILYFPTDGSEVIFRGYYPYKSDLDPTLQYSLSTKDQSVLADIDFMTVEQRENFSAADPNVNLYFRHRLSKFDFKLSVDALDDTEAAAFLAGATLAIKGMKTEAKYNLLTEQMEVNAASELDMVTKVTGLTAAAIVLPTPSVLGVEIEVTTAANGKYTAVFEDTDLEIEGGYRYTLNVRLKSPAKISAIIEPWLEGPERSMDVVRIVTGLGDNIGFNTDDEVQLYLKDDGTGTFNPLMDYTYLADGTWEPASPLYWEGIPGNSATFRATSTIAPALNSTQIDDILVADDIDVDHYTGINLLFHHKGSKVNIELVSSDGTYTQAQLDGATVILPDYLNNAYINGEGEFVIGPERDDVTFVNGVAIIPPQTVLQGDYIITVEIAGRLYEVKAEDLAGFIYEGGTAYNLKLDVAKSDILISTQIVDWTEKSFEFQDVRVGSLNLGSNGGDLLDGDELFLFAGTSSDREAIPGVFTYDATTDKWIYSGPNAPLYWEDITAAGNLYGSITRPAITTATGTNQSKDYITADPIANSGGVTNSAINFTMSHKVAKVNVVLRTSNYEEARLLDAAITLPGYAIGGGLNNGIYVPGTGVGTIKLDKPVKVDDGGVITYQTAAYLQPQTVAVGEELVVIVVDGRTYTITPDMMLPVAGDVEYKAGEVTHLIIDIEKSEVKISTRITDWVSQPPLETTAIHLVTDLDANDGSFVENDVVTLYYKSGGLFNPTEAFTMLADGTWSPGNPLYWEDFPGTNGTFKGTATKNIKLNGTQVDDIVVSSEVTVDHYKGINLQFTHAGAKVVLELVSADGTYTAADLAAAGVRLPNYLNDASLDANGNYVVGGGKGDITFENNVAIIPPQIIANGDDIIEIVIDGRTYNIKAEDIAGFEYKAGTSHLLRIDLRKSDVKISTQLADWSVEMFEFDEIRIGGLSLGANSGNIYHGDELFLFTGDAGTRTAVPGSFTYNIGAASWEYSGPISPLYWEDIAKDGNIYAHIVRPAMDPAPGKNQMPDIITATPIVNTGGVGNTAIHLDMDHKLSRVVVALRTNTYEEARMLDAKITLPNYQIGGYVDKGIYVPGTSVGDITLTDIQKDSDGVNTYYVAGSYLQPQTIPMGSDAIVVEIDGRTYHVDPSQLLPTGADLVYPEGKALTLIVTIEKSRISVSTEVTPWDVLPHLEFEEALFFNVNNLSSTGFENNDVIKFYKLNSAGTAVDGEVNDYIYSGGPAHGTLSPVGTPWYRDDFRSGDLIAAVHPSAAPLLAAGESSFNWTCNSSDPTNGHGEDIMVAKADAVKNLGVIQSTADVAFEFVHVLSKVTINLLPGTGFTPAEVMAANVALNNLMLSGSIDVITAEATATGSATASFNPTKLATPNAITGKTVVSSYEAFVMPQTITGGTIFITVELNGVEFEASLTVDKELSGGSHNVFNITLNKSGLSLSTSIIDWNDEPDTDIELQ